MALRRTVVVPLRLAVLALLCLTVVAEAAGELVVAYPDINGPYRAVFEQIIDGVEQAYSGPVVRLPLAAKGDPNLDDARAILARSPDAVIALGHSTLGILEPLRSDVPMVVGAVLTPPSVSSGTASGISLVPDPELLFAQLGEMVPAITRVHVVVDRQRLAWLIEHAEIVAEKHGVTLAVYDVADLSAAAREYQTLLDSMDSGGGALWLLADKRTMDNKSLLPFILRKAWERDLLVFSNSLAHVNRGALFALYPDHRAMGQRLVAVARLRIDNPSSDSAGLLPLRSLRLAVNSRTARHLGLKLNLEAVAREGLVFPRQ